jgi:hypothetical protein
MLKSVKTCQPWLPFPFPASSSELDASRYSQEREEERGREREREREREECGEIILEMRLQCQQCKKQKRQLAVRCRSESDAASIIEISQKGQGCQVKENKNVVTPPNN